MFVVIFATRFASAGEEGLLLYYPCDEKSGTVLHDAGPYHKDGSLNAITNGEERGVSIICKKAGEWVPIINAEGVQRKGIVPGSDSALAEGERPIVLDRDKDYAIDYTNGLIKALEGGRVELDKPFTLDFKFSNPGPQWVEGKKGGGIELDGVDDYLTFGQLPEREEVGPITIEYWISFWNADTRGFRKTWTHMVTIMDGTNTVHWLNGKKAGSDPNASLNRKLLASHFGGTRNPLFLRARVDEIKIYNRAKTAEEIAKDAAQ